MKHNTTQQSTQHTQGVSNIYETHLRRKLQTVGLWRQRQSLMGTLSQKPRSPSVWGSEEHPKIENEDEDFHEDKNYEDDDLKVGALTVIESRHFQKDGDSCIMHLTLTIEVIIRIKKPMKPEIKIHCLPKIHRPKIEISPHKSLLLFTCINFLMLV